MHQLYLLTVLTNVFAGLALSYGFLSRNLPRFSKYSDFMMNTPYRVILGGLSLIIAIINLFQTYPGDIAVVSELFPSTTGFTSGLLLLVEFWHSHIDNEDRKSAEVVEKVQKFSKPFHTIVGIVTVIVGVIHAFIPNLPPF